MIWRVSLVLEPTLVAVRRASAVFKSAIAEFGTQEVRQELELAFVEACTNSAIHGSNDSGAPEIRVALTIDSAEVVIVIQDGGQPFDPFKKERAIDFGNVASLPCGGFGLSLIRRICDSVDYEHNEQGNCLTLRKGFVADCAESLSPGGR